MDDDNEIIAEGSNIETAVSHVAYDYYMAYIKDDMPHFKEASELLDIVIFHTLTHPNMIAYVNYCKVAASNEILNKLFDRDFKLKEPSAVAIDESWHERCMELFDEVTVDDALREYDEDE